MFMTYQEIIDQLIDGTHVDKDNLIKGKSFAESLLMDINRRLEVEK